MGPMISTPDDDAPYHAHIYCRAGQMPAAEALQAGLRRLTLAGSAPHILFVGQLTKGKAGPHPIPQFEFHFLKRELAGVMTLVEGSGLTALVHPLTDDDLADHTTLAHWVGEPIELDLTTLDPPGVNQGVPRFGKTDF